MILTNNCTYQNLRIGNPQNWKTGDARFKPGYACRPSRSESKIPYGIPEKNYASYFHHNQYRPSDGDLYCARKMCPEQNTLFKRYGFLSQTLAYTQKRIHS